MHIKASANNAVIRKKKGKNGRKNTGLQKVILETEVKIARDSQIRASRLNSSGTKHYKTTKTVSFLSWLAKETTTT